MARKLVVGNWKMNLGPQTGQVLLRDFRALAPAPKSEVAFCVPSPLLGVLHGEGLEIGAQDVFWLDAGAYTGFVSPGLLVELGVKRVLVGHSERRGRFGKREVPESTLPFFGETDETVNLKVRACEAHALQAIVCVGETLAERQAGRTDEIVLGQVRRSLDGVEKFSGVFAYEPVWAIGTGEVCGADEAARVCGVVAKASGARTLYGGSVSAKNAAELFARPEIAGGLVGGASMKAAEFAKIVAAADTLAE